MTQWCNKELFLSIGVPADECSLLAWIQACLPFEWFGISCKYPVLADPVDLAADPADQPFRGCLRPTGDFEGSLQPIPTLTPTSDCLFKLWEY